MDVRSRLMMDFGVDGAACKSPASICVMGPSFFARQAAAEPESLLVDVRQAPPEDGSTTAPDGASHLAGGGELPPMHLPSSQVFKSDLGEGQEVFDACFQSPKNLPQQITCQGK